MYLCSLLPSFSHPLGTPFALSKARGNAIPRNCSSSPVCCRAVHGQWLQTKQNCHRWPHSPGLCNFHLLPLLVQSLFFFFSFSYPSAVFRKINWMCCLLSVWSMKLLSLWSLLYLFVVLQDIPYICRAFKSPEIYVWIENENARLSTSSNLIFWVCCLLAKISLWNLQEWCSWL